MTWTLIVGGVVGWFAAAIGAALGHHLVVRNKGW